MEKTVVLENGVVRGILGEESESADLFVLGNVLGEVEAVALGSSATLQGRNLARAGSGRNSLCRRTGYSSFSGMSCSGCLGRPKVGSSPVPFCGRD